MQAIILILRPIQKQSPFIIEGHSAISAFEAVFVLMLILKLFLLEISDKFFVMLLTDVTEEQVVKGFDICIRALSNYVYSSLRPKQVLY